MLPWQECEVGVSLLPEGSRSIPCLPGCEGALRSRFPLWQPISCLEPWDFIHLLHLDVRVVLRNVEVGLSCARVSAAGPGSGGHSVSDVPACP